MDDIFINNNPDFDSQSLQPPYRRRILEVLQTTPLLPYRNIIIHRNGGIILPSGITVYQMHDDDNNFYLGCHYIYDECYHEIIFYDNNQIFVADRISMEPWIRDIRLYQSYNCDVKKSKKEDRKYDAEFVTGDDSATDMAIVRNGYFVIGGGFGMDCIYSFWCQIHARMDDILKELCDFEDTVSTILRVLPLPVAEEIEHCYRIARR